jgi:hypothetical protein
VFHLLFLMHPGMEAAFNAAHGGSDHLSIELGKMPVVGVGVL